MFVRSMYAEACAGCPQAAAKGEAYLPMFAMVDVRDIARAHVRAAERPQAQGRYLCTCEKKITGKQMQRALEERFPEYSFKDMEDGESPQYADNLKVCRSPLSCCPSTMPCVVVGNVCQMIGQQSRARAMA